MTARLAVRHLTAVKGQGPVLLTHGAEPAAVGAGLPGAQGVGLLLEQDGQGPFGQAGGGGAGDVLHGLEIDGAARPGVAESLASDNFAPLRGEVADGLEVMGGQRTVRHGWFFLGLARRDANVFLLPLYRKAHCPTKLFMASRSTAVPFSA
jgi:hypothetical protein